MMGAVVRLALAVLLLLVTACTRAPEPPPAGPLHPDLRLQGVAIRSWAGAELRVITTATRLDLYRERGPPGEVVASDAGVRFVSNGSLLRAPLVTGNLFAGQFVGQGGVTLDGPGGLRAQTERVAFDRALGAGGEASSDAGVRLTQPGLELQAAGFTFDVNDEHATFFDVRSTFSTP